MPTGLRFRLITLATNHRETLGNFLLPSMWEVWDEGDWVSWARHNALPLPLDSGFRRNDGTVQRLPRETFA